MSAVFATILLTCSILLATAAPVRSQAPVRLDRFSAAAPPPEAIFTAAAPEWEAPSPQTSASVGSRLIVAGFAAVGALAGALAGCEIGDCDFDLFGDEPAVPPDIMLGAVAGALVGMLIGLIIVDEEPCVPPECPEL